MTCARCGAPIKLAADEAGDYLAHVVGDLDADHDAVRAPE